MVTYGGYDVFAADKLNDEQNDLYQVKAIPTAMGLPAGAGVPFPPNLACNVTSDVGLSCHLDTDPTIDIFKNFRGNLLIQDSKGTYGTATTLSLKVFTQP